jgi:uncharacterized membrane protein YgcG
MAALSGACAPLDPDPDLGRARGAIIGGSPTQGDPAVVMLVSYPPDHTTFDTCTASVIAPDVLLTAAHCLDPATHPGYLFGVFTGADASAYQTANTLVPQLEPAKEVHMHPGYDTTPPFTADIGVVVMKEALGVEPLPIQRAPLGDAIVGSPARLVGYGQTKYKEPNATKHEATTVVAALGKDDTVIVGDLERRSCVGDSGGPALVKMDGVERIIGVDSYTELTGCLEPAHYRRPDVYIDFLDAYVPPPGDGSGGGSGSGNGGGGGSGDGGGSGGGAPDVAGDDGEGCSAARGNGAGRAAHGPGLFVFVFIASMIARSARVRRRRSP